LDVTEVKKIFHVSKKNSGKLSLNKIKEAEENYKKMI